MNPNDPAFPSPTDRAPTGEVNAWAEPGMSLRAYFAGLAMQGLSSNPFSSEACKAICGDASISKASIELADALIEALNKPTT